MDNDMQFAEQCEDCAEDAALYALGALPAEKTGAVELRLQSGCPFCAAQVKHFAAVAEHLTLSVKRVEPRPEVRQRLLLRLGEQEKTPDLSEHRKVVRGHDSPWLQMPIPGVEVRRLLGEKTFLVRLQPGAVFPKHEHPQAEQCYVLTGSITDSDGLTLHAGDFVVMSRGVTHEPIRSESGCTLFIAYAD